MFLYLPCGHVEPIFAGTKAAMPSDGSHQRGGEQAFSAPNFRIQARNRCSPAIADHPRRPLRLAEIVEQQQIAICIHALPEAAVVIGAKLVLAR
jgi:hypothetical protein